MSKKSLFSYQKYLEYLSSLSKEEVIEREAYMDRLISDRIRLDSSNLPFVLSYVTQTYSYFGDYGCNIVGQPTEAFYEGGWDFTRSIWDPRDLAILNEKIFKNNLLIFDSCNEIQIPTFRIKYNFRVRSNDGTWIHILQQSTLLRYGQEQFPVASFGTVTNITAYKSDSKVTHIVEKLTPEGTWLPVLINCYYPDIESDDLLSKTEVEVLKWILEGFSSEAIAARLNRSIHTVKTHRKNMLEKTNAKNIAELLKFAADNGII